MTAKSRTTKSNPARSKAAKPEAAKPKATKSEPAESKPARSKPAKFAERVVEQQVSDRVHGVVKDWSGTPSFTNTEPLTDIWNRTRLSNGHDYPFDKGGSDSLAKMLNTEFEHPPQASSTISALNFPPTGNLKSVSDLIQSYNADVISQ